MVGIPYADIVDITIKGDDIVETRRCPVCLVDVDQVIDRDSKPVNGEYAAHYSEEHTS